jgi:hypothetical protein
MHRQGDDTEGITTAVVGVLHQQPAGAPRRAGVLSPRPSPLLVFFTNKPLHELGFSYAHRQATTGMMFLALDACW